MIIFDTETTGLIENIAIPVKRQPRIIELYALKIEDCELRSIASQTEPMNWDSFFAGLKEWHSLFWANEVPAEVTRITGLKTDDLATAPHFAAKFESLAEFFRGERLLCGHNLSFDRDMLSIELRRMGKQCAFPWPFVHIDTVEATEGEDGFRLALAALHEKLFGTGFDAAHRAKSDVTATTRCVVELIRQGKVKI